MSQYSTCVMKGLAKYFLVGSVPAACYDFEHDRSKLYDTEQEAIEAAIAAGATRVQAVDCSWVKR